MKVCIYGAGAVGGEAAARLMATGAAEVSLVARGAHLAAIRERGLTLRSADGEQVFHPQAATDDPATLPAQDLVMVALKSHQLPEHAGRIAALLAPGASALFMTNGIPWWWNHGLGEGGPLPLLDPQGGLWQNLRERALCCLVYVAAEVVAPGVVERKGSNRWVLGDPAGPGSPRLDAVARLFAQAGMNATVSNDIRRDVWTKLSFNCCLGPTCALTRLTVHEVQSDPALHAILTGLLRETWAVAAACGWQLGLDAAAIVEPRPGSVGIRPSMLQDVLAGRPVEADALLGQTRCFARERKIATPTIDCVYALLCGLDRARLP